MKAWPDFRKGEKPVVGEYYKHDEYPGVVLLALSVSRDAWSFDIVAWEEE